MISCAEDLPRHVALPRGCVDGLERLLAEHRVAVDIEDRRTDGDPIDVRFLGELTPAQSRAADALAAHDTGVLVAPPGSGKTVVGAHLVARRGRSTLVLVHRSQLLDQWVAQLGAFLGLPRAEIGRIGGGGRRSRGKVDVAMMQSVVRRDAVDDIVGAYGHVIVDECHHVPAVSFERVLREVPARYVTGLTATPRRRDGHHPILHLQLGPVRYTMDRKDQGGRRLACRLVVRETSFRPSSPARPSIQEIYRELASDEDRNHMILDDVIRALEDGRSPLLLSERRDHVAYFAERLDGVARNLVVLRGGMRGPERRRAMERLASIPETEERLVLATGRYVGEGFDDARLDTLFLAMPISWRGTLEQYAGRLHRRHRAKDDVLVVDYVDRQVPMLDHMFAKRMRGYRAMGYVVDLDFGPTAPDVDPIVEYDEGGLDRPA